MSNGKVRSNEVQAFQVIRIGMGENEIVNPVNLLFPQEGCNDVLPDVKAIPIKATSISAGLFSSCCFRSEISLGGKIRLGLTEKRTVSSSGESVCPKGFLAGKSKSNNRTALKKEKR